MAKDYKTINGNDLMCLQPRQLEQMYWYVKGNNWYGVAHKMGLSNNSIPTRLNLIRKALGLNSSILVSLVAKRNKEWILENAIVKGKK